MNDRKRHVVDLTHAASFDGQTLSDDEGWNKYKGQCAAGVQYVFFKAGKPIGKTDTWKEGSKVKGSNAAAGTAIASFRDGEYKQDHAAILIKETDEGLEVWDQYISGPKPWGKRVLRFTDDNDDYSNNGKLFSIIETE